MTLAPQRLYGLCQHGNDTVDLWQERFGHQGNSHSSARAFQGKRESAIFQGYTTAPLLCAGKARFFMETEYVEVAPLFWLASIHHHHVAF
jgi:hypothetical protein